MGSVGECLSPLESHTEVFRSQVMESATFFQKVQKKKRCVCVSSETEEANVTKYW